MRSPPRIERSEPLTSPSDLAGDRPRRRRASCHSTPHRRVELGERLRSRPRCRRAPLRCGRRTVPVAVAASSMTASDVRSPSRPKSSASARATTSRTDGHRRIEVADHALGCADVDGQRMERRAPRRPGRTGRAARSTRSGKSSRVCVPRDSSRAERRGRERPADRRAGCAARSPRDRRPRTSDGRTSRTPCRLVAVAQHAGARRSSPAGARRARSGPARDRRRGLATDGRTCRAARSRRSTPVGFGPVLARDDRVHRTRREHEAVEQRVRREPVRAVHAGARGLAAGPEPGQRRRAVEVGRDATAEVVRGRRDREPVASAGRGRRPARTARSSGSGPGSPGSSVASSQRWSRSAVDEPAGDRPGHDVPGREVGQRVLVGHERDAVLVAQHRALAPERLREQRAGHRRVVQRGRVELHELDVRDRRAGAQRERDPVAGRHHRVGGHREQLARRRRSRRSCRAPGSPAARRRDPAPARRRSDRPRRSGRPRSTARARRRDRARAPRRRARARSPRRSRHRPRARPARPSDHPRARARARRSRRRRCGRTPRRAPSGRGPGPDLR